MEQRLEEIYQLLSNKLEENEANIRREIKSEMAVVKTVLQEVQVKQQQMEEIIAQHKYEIAILKKEVNKNNIIIHGLPEHQNESSLENEVIMTLEKELEIAIPPEMISDCYRLGKDKTKCPIKVCFTSAKIKHQIFENKKKLKTTNIFINDDLPREIRIINAEKRKARKEMLNSAGNVPMQLTPPELNNFETQNRTETAQKEPSRNLDRFVFRPRKPKN